MRYDEMKGTKVVRKARHSKTGKCGRVPSGRVSVSVVSVVWMFPLNHPYQATRVEHTQGGLERERDHVKPCKTLACSVCAIAGSFAGQCRI